MASSKELTTIAAAGTSLVLEGVGNYVVITNLNGAGYASFSTSAAPGSASSGEGLVGLAAAPGARAFLPASRDTSGTVTVYGKASADLVASFELVHLT